VRRPSRNSGVGAATGHKPCGSPGQGLEVWGIAPPGAAPLRGPVRGTAIMRAGALET